MAILCALLGLLVGGMLVWKAAKPKISQRVKLDIETQRENEKLSQIKLSLQDSIASQQKRVAELQELVSKWQESCSEVENTLAKNKKLNEIEVNILFENKELCAKGRAEAEGLENRIKALKQSFEDLRENAEASAQSIEKAAMEVMAAHFEAAAEKERLNFLQAIQEYRKEYDDVREDIVQSYLDRIEDLAQKATQTQDELDKIANRLASAMRADLVAQSEENKDFYKIDISNIDALEIEKMRSILPFLRNPRPIIKAIWESYYRTPTGDMINRVVGKQSLTGIYKITSLLDGRVYIGQAVDIADRWRTHVKCGVGIDAPQTKLYSAMQKDGVENYTFEVLLECPAAKLNEEEKYWINFYQSNKYGFNMNAGGSKAK